MSRAKRKDSRRAGFGYFVQQGLSGVFVHGFMSFAAITVIAACLLITATFALVAHNIDLKIVELESQSEIVVYIDEAMPEEEAKALGDKLKALDNIDTVEYITKDQLFDQYITGLGDDGYVMEDIRKDNPLRNSYRVTMKDIAKHAETVKALEDMDGIASSSSQKEVSDKLIQIRRVVNMVSYTLIGLLGAVSVFIVSNTVKLAMFSHREEIGIMKMVGATNHFIRAPYVVEGMALGIMAAILAFFAQWGVYNYITSELVDGTAILAMVPFAQVWAPLAIILTIAGVIMGTLGSVITIRRFLKV